jgi:hypothetical protein
LFNRGAFERAISASGAILPVVAFLAARPVAARNPRLPIASGSTFRTHRPRPAIETAFFRRH